VTLVPEGDPPRLTLLTRAYCHLCEEMRAALEPFTSKGRLAIEEIDVDREPALETRWGDKVPVLLAGERELCHYRLDRAALASYLASAAR